MHVKLASLIASLERVEAGSAHKTYYESVYRSFRENAYDHTKDGIEMAMWDKLKEMMYP